MKYYVVDNLDAIHENVDKLYQIQRARRDIMAVVDIGVVDIGVVMRLFCWRMVLMLLLLMMIIKYRRRNGHRRVGISSLLLLLLLLMLLLVVKVHDVVVLSKAVVKNITETRNSFVHTSSLR